MTDTWREFLCLERFRVGDKSPIVAEVGNLDGPMGDSEEPSGHFTAWSAERVYFSNVYDGFTHVSSVPRSPRDEVFGFDNADSVGDDAVLGRPCKVDGRLSIEWGDGRACKGVIEHFGDPCESCGATRGLP